MKDYIDKETRQFLLIFAGLCIFLYFIFPRIDGYLFDLDFSQPIAPLFPNAKTNNTLSRSSDFKLAENKDYKASVSTNLGDFEMDLFEKSAPKNVANFISLTSFYTNAPVTTETNYLFKVTGRSNVQYTIDDEINADYLLLDRIKVRDAIYLRDAYDPNDSSTKAFSPDNLRKYEDFTLKQFYSEIIGYKYDTTLSTPRAVRYTVFMANTGPNTNKINFFVVMAGTAPEIDGRYTPIGRITEGFTVVDKINSAQGSGVKINSIKVN